MIEGIVSSFRIFQFSFFRLCFILLAISNRFCQCSILSLLWLQNSLSLKGVENGDQVTKAFYLSQIQSTPQRAKLMVLCICAFNISWLKLLDSFLHDQLTNCCAWPFPFSSINAMHTCT